MRRKKVKAACRIATGFHALLCGAALLMVPLNAVDMAGEPDLLAGILAILMATPWILLADTIISNTSVEWNMFVASACMALNAVILWSTCNWFSGKSAR